MRMLTFAEIREGVCRFTPQGEYSLIDAVELITGAIAYCRDRRIDKLLVNVTGLVGIPVPSLVDRFLMVEEWAREAKGMVSMVLVVPAEYIDPERFGMKVAADLGMVAEIRTSEADALKWLWSNAGPA
jgi:hypothetical protein